METLVQSQERLVVPVVVYHFVMFHAPAITAYVQQFEREWTSPTLRVEWIPWCDIAYVPTLDSGFMDHAR
jgi:GH25 family lysozyme M1 (1,4-beta-N-acetylmuramidase)